MTRAVVLVGVALVADVALTWLDYRPDHLKLLLVVVVVLGSVVVLIDTMVDSEPGWDVEPLRPMTVPGSDHGLSSYVRTIEGHLSAASPDAALRDRLRRLCDERLQRRHGLTRDDPRARDLLGDDLLDDLAGPPQRLSRARIDDHLTRIEEL
ncbi:hypothetical protein [Nocardioides taihuensis]|uniref:Uncharacterized protein n=1 Tax=Nocardioides taihuensis TaxID=1835606 RepID=A0ABW0BMM3_9ACTN